MPIEARAFDQEETIERYLWREMRPSRLLTQAQVLEYRVQRIVQQLESLGMRIARLARALHIPLGSVSGMQSALECDEALALKTGARANHIQRMREELRALLILRYRILQRLACNPHIGVQATQDMLHCANEMVLSKGFSSEDLGAQLPV